MKLRQIVHSILSLCLAIHLDETGGFWLWRTFLSERSFEDNQCTEVITLPRQGIISNLMLEIRMTGGTQKTDIMSQKAITKVEVIGNGSTVIQSLDGTQLQASMAWDDNQLSNDKEDSPSGGCYAYFDIRFGRYVGDPLYALDCSKWASLELKITFDIDAGGTQGTTGYVDDTGKLHIYGLYSPDGAGLAPLGYIKKALKKVYTTTAGGTIDLELPTDYPYRRLILLMTDHAHVPTEAWQYITIDINDGARKPIDNMKTEQWAFLDRAMRGNPVYHHMFGIYIAGNTTTVASRVGFINSAQLFIFAGTYASGNIGIAEVFITCSAGQGRLDVFGHMPEKSVCIDLEKWSGGKHGIEAMMDTFGYDQLADIHLKATQQSASLSSQVVLEQYASHPVPA